MNTKQLPSKFISKRKKIIELHKQEVQIQEIKKLTNAHPSVIKRIIERNQSEEKIGIFNVNKHDCWLAPTS